MNSPFLQGAAGFISGRGIISQGGGRFTREDPHWYSGNRTMSQERRPDLLAVKQSGNLYIYAVNNPVLYTDSSGEEVWGTLGAQGSASFGIGSAGAEVITIWDDLGNTIVIAAGSLEGEANFSIGAGVTFYLHADASSVFEFANGLSATSGVTVSITPTFSATIDYIFGKETSGSMWSGMEVKGTWGLSIAEIPGTLHAGVSGAKILGILRYRGESLPDNLSYDYFSNENNEIRDKIAKDLGLRPEPNTAEFGNRGKQIG